MDAAVSPLAPVLAVLGSLLLTLGLGELLWGRRGTASPPEWWGRLDDPVPEPSPAPVYAGVGGSPVPSGLPARPATHEGSPRVGPPSGDPSPTSDGRPDSPQNLGPAYQAIVLAPAGRWGNYWQEVGRCQHRHATADAAYDCACGLPLTGRPEGAIVAVGPAE